MSAFPAERAVASRKPTNVSLDQRLVRQAKELGINLSRACEEGLNARIDEERAKRWRSENAEAIASSNSFTEERGLPLARFRRF